MYSNPLVNVLSEKEKDLSRSARSPVRPMVEDSGSADRARDVLLNLSYRLAKHLQIDSRTSAPFRIFKMLNFAQCSEEKITKMEFCNVTKISDVAIIRLQSIFSNSKWDLAYFHTLVNYISRCLAKFLADRNPPNFIAQPLYQLTSRILEILRIQHSPILLDEPTQGLTAFSQRQFRQNK